MGKKFTCQAGDPGSWRSPGEGNGNPLQSSCLENSMDRGAWGAAVHGVAKSRIHFSNSMTAADRREKPWDYQPCITIPLTCAKSSQDTDHVHHCKFLLVTASRGQQTTLLSRDKRLQTSGLFKYIRSLSRLCKCEVSQESGRRSVSWAESLTAQGEKGPEFHMFLLGLRGRFRCFHLEKRNFIWRKRKRVNYELEKDSEGEIKKWKKRNSNRSLGRVGWERR